MSILYLHEGGQEFCHKKRRHLRLDNTAQEPFLKAPAFLTIHNMVSVIYISIQYHLIARLIHYSMI